MRKIHETADQFDKYCEHFGATSKDEERLYRLWKQRYIEAKVLLRIPMNPIFSPYDSYRREGFTGCESALKALLFEAGRNNEGGSHTGGQKVTWKQFFKIADEIQLWGPSVAIYEVAKARKSTNVDYALMGLI